MMDKTIKIFVSHRIDKVSKLIDNPLYVPVRCGACFDHDNLMGLLGDNTGENISEKRKSFCELTVHYWAWKNQKADYYGLCHYRRFLSFANREYKENNFGVVEYPEIDETFVNRFNLYEDVMRSEIEKYDIVTANYIPVEQSGDYDSVYDYCKKTPAGYIEKDIDLLYDVVNDLYPEDLKYVKSFFEGKFNCWYNCFVMKADIFNEYSKWLFDILFELEKRADVTYYTQEQLRLCGVMAERLLGAFIEKSKEKGVKICFKQLAYVKDTSPITELQENKDEINICIPTNNVDIGLVATTIRSIQSYVSDKHVYRIFCLHDNLTSIYKEKIDQQIKQTEQVKIEWVTVSTYIDKYVEAFPILDRISASDFAVFDIFNGFSKILFVRSGMIICNDIAELFSVELGDSLIGASIDALALAQAYNLFGFEGGYTKTYLLKELGLPENYQFYNTDIMLMNMKKIKETYSALSVVEMGYLHPYVQIFNDIVNLKFIGKIAAIPMKWNSYIDKNDWIADWIRWFTPNSIFEEFEQSFSNQNAVNYRRYWPFPDLQVIGKDFRFWEEAKKTLFYEMLLTSCLQLYVNMNQPNMTQGKKSLLRKILDGLFPFGTRRREAIKKIIPRGSKRWNTMQKVYYNFRVQTGIAQK